MKKFRKLPRKEAKVFRELVELYESGNYDRGLILAEKILNEYPNHGETLSMKGLILHSMDLKSEALEFVQRGLQENSKSYVCWHASGLLNRFSRRYNAAIQCYQEALKFSPPLTRSIQILQDLSFVQTLKGDLSGLVETREKILSLNSNDRMNWIFLAVSHQLNSDAPKAVDILEKYERTLPTDYPPDDERHEHGDMLLYKISLMEECGFLVEALEELEDKESKIVDDIAFKEQQGSLLVKLNRLEEGEKVYKALLTINPYDHRYHSGLQKCAGLSSDNGKFSTDQTEKLHALYQSLKNEIDVSSAVEGISLGFLDFLEGEKFRETASIYIRSLLTWGDPSLFSDLCHFYEHPSKGDIIEQLILELENSIDTTGGYPGREEDPPSTLPWVLYLLAQHHDRHGKYETALARIDEAIKHTPTIKEFYLVKGSILKHAGDLVAAAALANKTRCMDLTDSFVRRECLKRMLQADQGNLAEQVAGSTDVDLDQPNNLHYLRQSMWFQLASGESYYRLQYFETSLRRFLAVEKLYAKTEDLFDFRSYPSQKLTLLPYVEMLRFPELLVSHSYYRKAIAGTIRCYMALAGMPIEEAAVCAKKESENKHEEKTTADVAAKPVGMLEGEKSMLVEARRYLKLLKKTSPEWLETHLLSFQLNIRISKMNSAYQAILKLQTLDADNPDSHRCLIRFYNKLGSMTAPVTDSRKGAGQFPQSQLSQMSLVKLNKEFLEKHKDSLLHRASAVEMSALLEPNKIEAIKIVEYTTYGAPGHEEQWSLKDCVAFHESLGTVLADSEEVALRWKLQFRKLFPFSGYFDGCRSSTRNNSAIWIFDSGANSHFAGFESILENAIPNNELVQFASRKMLQCSKMGSTTLYFSSGVKFRLSKVLFAPQCHKSCVSVFMFTNEHSCCVEFNSYGFIIRDGDHINLLPRGLILASGVVIGKLYYFLSQERYEDSPTMWLLDSGAAMHATRDRTLLQNIEPCEPGCLTCPDGSEVRYTEVGSCMIYYLKDYRVVRFMLKNVVHLEGIPNNIISVQLFTTEQMCTIDFFSSGCYVVDARDCNSLNPNLIKGSGFTGVVGNYVHTSSLQKKIGD